MDLINSYSPVKNRVFKHTHYTPVNYINNPAITTIINVSGRIKFHCCLECERTLFLTFNKGYFEFKDIVFQEHVESRLNIMNKHSIFMYTYVRMCDEHCVEAFSKRLKGEIRQGKIFVDRKEFDKWFKIWTQNYTPMSMPWGNTSL
jgi:hypothetical protein